MRARYYNSDIKRFINQDIKVGDIGSSQSLNRYAYCEGNPVSLVDPFGLCKENTQDQGKKSKFETLHTILDFAGFAFDVADVINAAIYAAEGDWGNALLSGIAIIPIAGSVIAGAAKGVKAIKNARNAVKVASFVTETGKLTKNASNAADIAADVMRAAEKWGENPFKMMDGITAEAGSKGMRLLETGGDAAKEANEAVWQMKAVVGADGIKLSTSANTSVSLFKNGFTKTDGIAKSAKKGSKEAKTFFRGDDISVTPDIVFSQGIKPKGTHNDPLLHTKYNSTPGNFVSTSTKASIAEDYATYYGMQEGYFYIIHTDNYIDMNAIYGNSAFHPHDNEFLIPGGIKASEIEGAYKIQSDYSIGEFIPNPNFGGN